MLLYCLNQFGRLAPLGEQCMGSVVRKLLYFPLRPAGIDDRSVVDISVDLKKRCRPKPEVIETTFEALAVNDRFLFEGQWWKKGELVGSLHKFSKKRFVGIGLRGKNKGNVRNFFPSEIVIVHRTK